MPEEAKRYFHGGNRGLAVGDYILPPTITNALSAQFFGDMKGRHRKDRCYITPELANAQFFGSGHPNPIVYEVEPEGQLEDDPDCLLPGVSYACERAKIVAVHKIPGKVIKNNHKKMLKRR